MKKNSWANLNPKLLIIPLIVILLIAAIYLGTQRVNDQSELNQAVEAGELTLTSVGRNHESVGKFVQNDEAQASQLLDAARMVLENARTRIDSAKQTGDEYLQHMVDNYETLADASGVMSQGVDNLLSVSQNMSNAFDYYSKGDYTKASQQASYCLQELVPLLSDFEASNSSLSQMDPFYIPSGQREKVTVGVGQYVDEMEIYKQYVLLLQSLVQGQQYLQANSLLQEYLRQLQNALANNDYQRAQQLLQQISQLLQQMRGSNYQDAANLAQQLNPDMLSGSAADAAQELRDRLRNNEGLDDFQNYLQALQKYMDALQSYQSGDSAAAQQAIDQAMQMLDQQGQGSGSGSGQGTGQGSGDLSGMYAGLRSALTNLSSQLISKEPPPPG